MTKHKNLCYRYSCNKFEFITEGICESYASNKSFDLLIDSINKNYVFYFSFTTNNSFEWKINVAKKRYV